MSTINAVNLKNPGAASNNIVLDNAGGASFQQIKGGALTLDTLKTTTSGANVDFTSVPSWAKRITVIFNGVSFSSTGYLLVQLGTSTGIENTGYNTAGTNFAGSLSSTAGFVMANGNAGFTVIGHMVLTLLSGNTWIGSHACMTGAGYFLLGGGSKTTTAAVDRVRITSTTGDTFDAGSINLLYEG